MKTKTKVRKSKNKPAAMPQFARTQRELAHILDVSREAIAKRMQTPGSPGKTSSGYDVARWGEHLRATSRISKLDHSVEASKLDQLKAKREMLCYEITQLRGAGSISGVWDILRAEVGGPSEAVLEKRAIEYLKARRLEIERDVRAGKLRDSDEINKSIGSPFAAAVQAVNLIKHQLGPELVGLDAGEASARIQEALKTAMGNFSLGKWAESEPFWGTIKKALDAEFQKHFPEGK